MSRDLIHRLEHAHARAEEASAAKSEFVANMSHEMRTPLQAVTPSILLSLAIFVHNRWVHPLPIEFWVHATVVIGIYAAFCRREKYTGSS